MNPNRLIARLMLALAPLVLLCLTPGNRSYAAPPASPPSITITIDDTVITRLLQLIQAHDDSAASIEAWIDLPGNRELLKVGAAEHAMTRAQLRANVKAVIDGKATEATQSRDDFGRVLITSPSDYRAMLAELHTRAHDWLTRSANRDAYYSPARILVNQTVYLHLGGDWDALNRDGAIFINMAFFHDYFTPSWFGLNLLIAHETFHAVQNAAFGNPESTANSDAAFYTALSKIQREGTARLVEVGADDQGYMPGTYGFYFRAVDNESLREFTAVIGLLDRLAAASYPQLALEHYQNEVSSGLSSGGPYYTLGEGMAAAIERYDGHARLVETVRRGPLDFFHCYADLTRRYSELPSIPPSALTQIERLRKAYPSGRLPVPDEPVDSAPTHA